MTNEPATGVGSVVDDFEAFAARATVALRRALVARYGVELGTEAAADAVAYAWEHRTAVSALANPLGYLFRVGQSSVRRNVRERRRLDLPAEAIVDEYGHIDKPEPGLPNALALLSDDQRVAVVLVHAHAYSYAEVAAVLDVPVSTVRNHVHRGLVHLRRHLEHNDGT